MTKKQILNEVIIGYRKVVEDRYQHDTLATQFTLPPFFNEERIAQFRRYFLEYIYPTPAKRDELDEAFASLDDYIKSPGKLLRILMDSGRLIFKYGRHLPKILRAGLRALHSFRTANAFEDKLVNQAIHMNIDPPFSIDNINQLIKSLPKEKIDEFIDSSHALFETLHDRVLVVKIIEIVEYLIGKMKQRPNVYSPAEIRGLEIGRDIISNGDALFDELPEEGQELLFDIVIQIERGVLDNLFSE